MYDEMWVSMDTIREAYPKYKGEWLISYYCYRKRGKLKNTKLYVTDRHGPHTWDFFVPDCEIQAKWYADYSTMEKRARIKDRKADAEAG